MNAATRRTIIAAAALAAIGLVAWPHQATPPQAQGVPTVHRDVALVDDFTTLLTDEGTLDTALVSDVSGAETTLYTDLSAPPSTTAIANALLDTTTGGAGDFNGAETAGFDGLYLDGLVTEDEVNQLVGATAAESQAEIESLVAADPSLLTAADVNSRARHC